MNTAEVEHKVLDANPEAIELLKRLNLVPVTQVRARRISYELDTIDFDIDCFPGIPPFMEIDMADAKIELKELLGKLGLTENEAKISQLLIHRQNHVRAQVALIV